MLERPYMEEEMTTAIANREKVQEFSAYFNSKRASIAKLIPRHLTVERVAKIGVAALMSSPKLLQCDPATVWFQVAQAASLGLEVNLLGAAYLVPFKDKCQLIIGYQGLIDLCRRSGHIEKIEAHCVYERDVFSFQYGINPTLHHEPYLDDDPGKVRLVYGVAWLKGGTTQFEVMTKANVDAIRHRSPAGKSGPWVTDYTEMARKTVVRRLCKYLPKSVELQQALSAEETGLGGMDIEAAMIDADIVPPPAKPTNADKISAGLDMGAPEGDTTAAHEPTDAALQELQTKRRAEAAGLEKQGAPEDACADYKELWGLMYGKRKNVAFVDKAILQAASKHIGCERLKVFFDVDHTDEDMCGLVLTELRRLKDAGQGK